MIAVRGKFVMSKEKPQRQGKTSEVELGRKPRAMALSSSLLSVLQNLGLHCKH